MKFKIGDKVRVVAPAYSFKRDFKGEVYTINRLNPNGENSFPEPHYGVDRGAFIWMESELALAVEDKIVITTDGKLTKATLYRGDVKFVGEAICSPEDKFDFRVGAKIAMERLENEVNLWKKKHELYNGKLICIKADGCLSDDAKVGKIYTFKDGMSVNERGARFTNSPIKSLDDINSRLKHIQFIELVED